MSCEDSRCDEQGDPATWFASPGRAETHELRTSLERLADNPLLDAMMTSPGGWVAVLNEHRQTLLVNDAFLQSLGIDDPGELLGLRLGEVVHCVHAHEGPNGCGTGRTCMSCGAAIALVAALSEQGVAERECALRFERGGIIHERCFTARCRAFDWKGERFLLVILQDISEEKRRIAIERTFLHDLSNTLTALGGAAELLSSSLGHSVPGPLRQIRNVSDILIREVQLQRVLSDERHDVISPEIEPILPGTVIQHVHDLLKDHPAGWGQRLLLDAIVDEKLVKTDFTLLVRVLTNMVINAFEAGTVGDRVLIGARNDRDSVVFCVWNHRHIPEQYVPRIFQRYFSTKVGGGRGLGTYTIKLLGETYLKGEVSFSSFERDGTEFRIRLPTRSNLHACSTSLR